MISVASISAAMARMRATSPSPRATVSTGVASIPWKSLRATPMRTVPTSMPRREPERTSPRQTR
jgi:hypothetical protein